MADHPDDVRLTLLEKADLIPGYLSVLATALYSTVAGIFRGNTGAKEYGVHVGHAIVRKMVTRFSMRQMQYVDQHPPLRSVNTVADVQEQVNFLLNEQSV